VIGITLLALKNIVKYYQKHAVLNKISYQFDKPRYCITGPNGSGKTTLLLLAAGLENPTSGSSSINGHAVASVISKRLIGISSDKINLPDFLTAQQLLEFHCQQHQCEFPRSLIHFLAFEAQLTTKVAALSLGNLKKTSLLLALSHQPAYLLLDEPTTGLDNLSSDWLLQYLTLYPGQIIVTSHATCFSQNLDYQQIALADLNQSEQTSPP
jgi:ABC-2 type transport system ATP-binding protein